MVKSCCALCRRSFVRQTTSLGAIWYLRSWRTESTDWWVSSKKLKAVNAWCKANRHRPLQEQHQHLSRVIRGHCNYYGLTGNSRRLSGFRYWVIRHWRKALARRTRAGRVTWDRMTELLNRYPLPPARVVHSIYAK